LDRRPYAEVRLLDRVVIGLLDTGASISAIGGKLAEQIIKGRVPFKRGASTVNTADGQRQNVIGRLKTPVQYEGKTEDFEMYIIPSLSQDLYLGIDFWSSFELLPPAMRVE